MAKPLLPKPVGRQVEVLYLPANGHAVVLGTAGSGKTTLAMLRSVHLANAKLAHFGRVLLLSYNNALLRYFESFANLTNAAVDARTYAHFARGYLNTRGRMRYGAICEPDERDRILEKAISDRLAAAPTKVLKRPLLFLVEEIKWLMQHAIGSPEEYVDAERTGREGARLARSDRPQVFALYERYRELRAEKGKLYDWDDLATAVLEEAQKDKSQRLYRHIVIDEGQDFSPMMLKSLAALVPANGTLTFFGDMAQQIYGNKLSWRNAGLSPPKVWHFQENYRNTRQIAALALAVAKMPYFTGTSDLVEPNDPTADGPRPALVKCASEPKELAFIAKRAADLALAGSVAILLPTRDEENALKRMLPSGAIKLHKDMTSWRHEPRVYYGTYAAAKGLEFDAVCLPRLSKTSVPTAEDIEAYGASEAAAAAGKRLYVGITRAKATLILSYTGEPTSLLPDGALYDRASV